jgi:O-antigen/teichoic acid export membrane protein
MFHSAVALFAAHLVAALVLFFATWGWASVNAAINLHFVALPRMSALVQALRESGAYGLAGLFALASQAAPLLMMGFGSQSENVVSFGGNQRVIQLTLGVLAVLSAAALPYLVTSTSSNRSYAIERYIGYLIAVSGILTGALIGGTDIIVGAVFGTDRPELRVCLVSLAALLPLYFLRSTCTDSLIAMGEGYRVLKACMIGFLASLAICTLAIVSTNGALTVEYGVLALAGAELTILVCASARSTVYLRSLKRTMKQVLTTGLIVGGGTAVVLAMNSAGSSSLWRLVVGGGIVAATLLTFARFVRFGSWIRD